MVLDGGQCSVGIESTIIDCTKQLPNILRPGSITKKMIEYSISKEISSLDNNKYIKYSGIFKSHYAPLTKVTLNKKIKSGDGIIALSSFRTPSNTYRLASPFSIEDFAKTLYASFRNADKMNLKRIVVILKNESELAEAIIDRVKKASSEKEN
jgi:L-threonylcarbamoyladenylate synthase